MPSPSSLIRSMSNKFLFGHPSTNDILQRAVQRVIRGPREVSFTFKSNGLRGMSFSCLTSHKYYFLREDFERDIYPIVAASVRPGKIVYDIGAHFGFWAIAISLMCGAEGRVFAFEPDKHNLSRLDINIESNGIHNVEIVPAVLSDSEGTLFMSGSGSVAKVSDSGDSVQATTIDAFVQGHPIPDFILLDVEGFAGRVLGGARQAYTRKFIPFVCEIHSYEEWESVQGFVWSNNGRLERIGRHRQSYPFHALALPA